MGLFDVFTGGTRPDRDAPKLSKDALLARLLDVRDEQGAWRMRRAEPGEGGADVVAEWAMSHDLRQAFGAAGEQRSFQILMRLAEEESVVRSVDKEVVARWTADAGALSLSGSVTAFRGQKVMTGGTWTFGRKPDGGVGLVDERRWSTEAIKRPLYDAATAAGWGWRGVAFGKL